MKAKFLYFGEGAKIPGTDLGLSVSFFKIWICPTGGDFKGYTTASNEGLLGYAIVESSVVDIVMTDLEDEEFFTSLHGATVDVTITSSTFVKSGGIATIKIIRKSNEGIPNKELTFFSDECRGISASVGDIHFVATLLELPANEWNPTGLVFVPV